MFRHYWVLVKLLLTVLVIVVLLLQMKQIDHVANAAAQSTLSSTDLQGPRKSLLIHAGGGLLVLLIPMVLSVYKPQGRTGYGRRKDRLAVDLGRVEGPTPRWVKVFAAVAGMLTLLVVILVLSDGGPGRHLGHWRIDGRP